MFLFRANHENELIFFTKEDVFSIDYMDEGKDRETLYTFKSPLDDISKFGVFNHEQTCFVVTSAREVWFVNTKTKHEVDIGEREAVSDIQNISLSSKNDEFFVLANKRHNRLGYYLFQVDIADPDSVYKNA